MVGSKTYRGINTRDCATFDGFTSIFLKLLTCNTIDISNLDHIVGECTSLDSSAARHSNANTVFNNRIDDDSQLFLKLGTLN
jgi:hypothetical protein